MSINSDLSELLFVLRVKTTVFTNIYYQTSQIFGKQINSFLEIYVRL
jgi:hypothetical protein